MAWYGPLFRVAGSAILNAAKAEYAQTATGRMFGEVQREFGKVSRGPQRLGTALHRYSRFGVRDALTQLSGSQFGTFAREIQRYSQSSDAGTQRLLSKFLNELGPAGKLISAVAGSQGTGEIQQLIKILQAFGYEVLPPRAARRRGEAVTERGASAAQEYLEQLGYRVEGPDEQEGPKSRGRLPFNIPAHGEDGTPRQQLALPMADGPTQRFGVAHPIVTGEMVDARSSNVHSFGYDIESAYLYVRFLGYVRGSKGADGHPLRAGPGSLYRYSNVTPEEFLTLLAANSKGSWVWDHLRVRGTWSGHQKDYQLVGVAEGYVPRKATVRIDPQSGRMQEYFVQRRVRAVGGGWLTSALPSEEAGPLPWGEVDRGRPDTGAPDRGEPNRG